MEKYAEGIDSCKECLKTLNTDSASDLEKINVVRNLCEELTPYSGEE